MLAEADFIKDLPISNRIKNRLIDSGFIEISQLFDLSLDKLKNIEGLGPTGIAEIREILYQKYKFVFIKEKKARKKVLTEPDSCKRVVEHFLGKENINWAKQLKIANQLLTKYSVDLLLKVDPKPNVYSLTWYNTDYGDVYISKYIPVTLISEEKPIKEKKEVLGIDFSPRISNKPKTLSEFLKT